MKSKILTALLAALIAFGLWFYVITVERPESENTFYSVPVVLDGEAILQDRGMMITSGGDTTVTLRLSGKRSELNKLKSSDLAAVVNLSRITDAGEKKLSYTVSIPGDSNIEVVSKMPDTLLLTVTEWATKEIPVELAYEGRVPEGYYADQPSAALDYENVTVTGPKEMINRIAKARITVDLDNRIETISESFRYALCDEENNPIEDVSTVTTDRGEIRVTLSVQRLKVLKLVYDILDGGGLTAEDVKVTAQHDSITVAGSTAALTDLEEINLGTVDLGELTESVELMMPVKLPNGVSNQSGFTEVCLTVELPELETRSYTIDQIRVDHAPQGLTVEIYTQVLEVKIRGRGPILDRILPEHITAVVDLEGQQEGIFSLPVEFEIEGFGTVDNVGAVDKYSVKGKLSQPEPEAASTAGN